MIFNPQIFNNAIFNTGEFVIPEVPIKTGTGGIDIYKPTGLLRRKKKKLQDQIEERVEESRDIQIEIAKRLAVEFEEKPIPQMSLREIETEIGVLLRRQEDEEAVIYIIAAL